MTLAQLEADLRALRECGVERVELQLDGRVFRVVGVERPSFRVSPGDDVAVLVVMEE